MTTEDDVRNALIDFGCAQMAARGRHDAMLKSDDPDRFRPYVDAAEAKALRCFEAIRPSVEALRPGECLECSFVVVAKLLTGQVMILTSVTSEVIAHRRDHGIEAAGHPWSSPSEAGETADLTGRAMAGSN